MPLDVTFGELLHEFAHELLHVDGKIFASLAKLLSTPGFLTREYFEGHRAAWVSPIRLYLIFSVIYFAMASFTPPSPMRVTVSDNTDPDAIVAIQSIGYQSEAELREAVNHAYATWTPRVLFVLVPFFAWLVGVSLKPVKRTYPQHLYFALHTHAAWFAAGAIGLAIGLLLPERVDKAFSFVVLIYVITYLILALARAYGRTRRQALTSAAIIVPVYVIAVALAVASIMVVLLFGRVLLGKLSATVVTAPAAAAQAPAVREEAQIHGRPGWIIDNGTIRVAILRGGGHIADIRLLSENARLAINPMFIPAGNGYMGHMVCFPNFGPASAEERQNGIGGHGEANSVEWRQTRPPQIDARGIVFFYGAELPKTQYRIGRAVSVKTGEPIVSVEEWIENLTPYDRPYNRDQHATFGGPFVASGKNVLDLSGTKGITDPTRTAGNQWASAREFVWPNAPATTSGTISLREFKAVPGGQAYTAVLADQSRPANWFTLYNVDYPLLVGYLFPTSDHPWIIDWQNRPNADSPAGAARGIEFGTSPIDEGLRKSVERGQLLGAASYKFITARQRMSTTFKIFLTVIPTGFQGVADVREQDGTIVVVERGGRQFQLETGN